MSVNIARPQNRLKQCKAVAKQLRKSQMGLMCPARHAAEAVRYMLLF